MSHLIVVPMKKDQEIEVKTSIWARALLQIGIVLQT